MERRNQPKAMLAMATVVAMVGVIAANPAAADEDPSAVEASVPFFWDLEGNAKMAGQPVGGAGQTTTATQEGVAMTVTTTGLHDGYAYTVWLSFFNQPENCVLPGPTFRCSVLDIFNPLTGGHAIYCYGFVSTGQTDQADCFWPVGTAQENPEHVAAGTGLLTAPLTAEYHVQIIGHGPYDPVHYGNEQYTTHDGGCIVQDSAPPDPSGNPCPHMQGNMLWPGR